MWTASAACGTTWIRCTTGGRPLQPGKRPLIQKLYRSVGAVKNRRDSSGHCIAAAANGLNQRLLLITAGPPTGFGARGSEAGAGAVQRAALASKLETVLRFDTRALVRTDCVCSAAHLYPPFFPPASQVDPQLGGGLPGAHPDLHIPGHERPQHPVREGTAPRNLPDTLPPPRAVRARSGGHQAAIRD